MASRRLRNKAMEMRKAKAEARVKALKTGQAVVTLASVDPDSVRRPLIFDNVRIPEADLPKLDEMFGLDETF